MRGAGRRGGSSRRGGSNNSRRAVVDHGATDSKTSLVDEWRAHEEDCAARVLQNQFRALLSRRRMARLLQSVYEKHYDPVRKRYYYVNTLTDVSTWEKPLLLARFLPGDRDIARGRVDLSPKEAALRIQRVGRAFLAKQTIRQLVRENYMKLFDPKSKVFYYLNTRTGDKSEQKPPFFRPKASPEYSTGISKSRSHLDDDDLEIEQFYFRKAVCKVSSEGSHHGSGVLGQFCGVLCIITDGKTLADENAARSARVICNYVSDRVSFPILLDVDTLFAGIRIPGEHNSRLKARNHPQSSSPKKKAQLPQFDFALCAVNESQFLLAAGDNVVPLHFEINDRKLGCGAFDSLRIGDPLEIVGHPHGKLQVLHHRHLAKLMPNSINPQHLQFDQVVETGAAGCGVFTRGGKLVGMHPFIGFKDAPMSCWYVQPILDTALTLVTPPEPFILTSCVGSTEVQVYWQLPHDWTPLPGLPVDFELEICRHGTHNALRHEPFERVYYGARSSHHLGDLQWDTMYSLRCRAVNRMKKSPWSAVVRFITLQKVSLAWRLRHCASVKEAIKRMQQQQADAQVQFCSVQWIYAQLEKRLAADRVEWETRTDGSRENVGEPVTTEQLELEQELLHCRGLESLLDSLGWFPNENDTIALVLRLLLKLTRLRKNTKQFLTGVCRFDVLCKLLRSQTETHNGALEYVKNHETNEKEEPAQNLQVPLLSLELIGAILDENTAAKQVFESCSGIELVLGILQNDSYSREAAVVAECCYVLSIFSYENASGKWRLAEANCFALLEKALQMHRQESRVLYWSLVSIGNVAYGANEESERPQLDAEISSLGLVDSVCDCRIHVLSRLHELELSLLAAQAQLDHLLAIHVGEETRNELDACQHLVQTLKNVLADWTSNDVAEAADYALRYLLTEEQRQVQLASQRLMRKFLRRTLSMALEKWCDATTFERHRSIFLMFIHTVRTRQLRPAFRLWEQNTREMRKHKTILHTIGSGLAIDLTKKKKERYRMLVLQK